MRASLQPPSSESAPWRATRSACRRVGCRRAAAGRGSWRYGDIARGSNRWHPRLRCRAYAVCRMPAHEDGEGIPPGGGGSPVRHTERTHAAGRRARATWSGRVCAHRTPAPGLLYLARLIAAPQRLLKLSSGSNGQLSCCKICTLTLYQRPLYFQYYNYYHESLAMKELRCSNDGCWTCGRDEARGDGGRECAGSPPRSVAFAGCRFWRVGGRRRDGEPYAAARGGLVLLPA